MRHKFFPEGNLSSLFVKGRGALYDLEVATAIHASPAGTYSAILTKVDLEKKAKAATAMSGILAEHLFLEDGDSNGPKKLFVEDSRCLAHRPRGACFALACKNHIMK